MLLFDLSHYIYSFGAFLQNYDLLLLFGPAVNKFRKRKNTQKKVTLLSHYFLNSKSFHKFDIVCDVTLGFQKMFRFKMAFHQNILISSFLFSFVSILYLVFYYSVNKFWNLQQARGAQLVTCWLVVLKSEIKPGRDNLVRLLVTKISLFKGQFSNFKLEKEIARNWKNAINRKQVLWDLQGILK